MLVFFYYGFFTGKPANFQAFMSLSSFQHRKLLMVFILKME